MDDQLKQLYDYTKFHIGLYTTLITAIVGVFGNSGLKLQYSYMVPYMKVTVILFMAAGAFGGLIASSIPFFTKFEDFRNARLGLWSCQWIPSIRCTHLEHGAFWLGCLIAVLGLFFAPPQK